MIAEAKAARVLAERDAARRIVQDIHWMARRYADGRRSYAPGMFNDAVRPAFEAGWLKPNGAADESQYARDGDFDAEWKSLEGRLAQAEAERDASCLRISEQDQQIGRLEGQVEGLQVRAERAEREAQRWSDAYDKAIALGDDDYPLFLDRLASRFMREKRVMTDQGGAFKAIVHDAEVAKMQAAAGHITSLEAKLLRASGELP